MARPFTQRNKFDVLGVEHGAEHYEEEEEPEVQPTSEPDGTPSTTPKSKSAKKRERAAKAAKASAGGTSGSEAGSKLNGSSEKTAAVNGNRADKAATAPLSQPAKTTTSSQKPAPTSSASELASQASEAVKAVVQDAKDAAIKTDLPSLPSSKAFKPELPDDLPQPKANALPANRKRRTPEDFSPTGPRDLQTPSSPSKNTVKFEDGVVAGEGQEGEKTIGGKKDPITAETIGAKKHSITKAAPKSNAIERTVWTFIMIGGFVVFLCMGHPYVICLVLLCQALVYKEVTALFDLRDSGSKQIRIKDNADWSKTLNWYFFVVTNYYLYGESIVYYFKHIVFVDAYFIPFAKNHRFISFMLYTLGFVGFVANLQKQHLRQQFALFCWVHITLLIVVVSSHFIVNNILEGLIWFWMPTSLVICNDIFAYICGKAFGRTPLIKLSPKKTVEGFVGAFICTLLFSLLWGGIFMQFPYMTCPARDLGVNVFSTIVCKPNPVFVWREFEFSGPLRKILETALGRAPPTFWYKPFQIHMLVMATFASLVAPFGGFFASGFKRAFNIKDFGHSIPGHGGMTDRMDCQFLMGMFAYVYYSSLIRIQNVSVGSILQTVVVSLTTEEQLELLADMKRFLEGQGVRV